MRKLSKNVTQKSRRVLLGLVILLVILTLPTYFWMKDANEYLAAQHNSRMSPVIMIPGSSATMNRFNQLVELLNKQTNKKHSLLRLEVENNGKIKSSGWINRGDQEPIIVVGFENNHDGYQNIKKQAKMFNTAFKLLDEKYNFNNFKAFGHSNGGLIWTLWLEKYYHQYSEQITIKRLMTLGTPYNFAETSIAQPTQMFNDLVRGRKKIPKSLDVYSVAGTESYDSDGLVPEQSVEAGKYIYQKQVDHYT
ncbi:MAG: alpha/beta hydrolase, partial [Limosilactobacillus sp.]